MDQVPTGRLFRLEISDMAELQSAMSTTMENSMLAMEFIIIILVKILVIRYSKLHSEMDSEQTGLPGIMDLQLTEKAGECSVLILLMLTAMVILISVQMHSVVVLVFIFI